MKFLAYRNAWLALLSMIPLLFSFHAIAATLECPKTMRVRQDILSKGDIWKGISSESEHSLKSAGFSDGPADEKAFLKPDGSKKTKQTRTVTWNFGKTGSDSVWLSCAYEGTSASFTRRVEGTVTECRISYEELQGQSPSLKQIVCE